MDPMTDTCPLIIAHRGYSARFPENTLASFEAAAAAGAPMLELDVTLSRDRQVVVIHDDTLERTTSGNGRVSDHSLSALQELDAGSWYDSRFAGQRIPLLEQVMDALLPGTMINVEIKVSAFEDSPPADAIERQVLALSRRFGALEKILVSSFEMRFLERLCSAEPSLRLAWISEVPLDDTTCRRLEALEAFSWHPDFKILDAEQVGRAHARGLRVFPWTVNSQEESRELFALGIDGLITDDPVRIAG